MAPARGASLHRCVSVRSLAGPDTIGPMHAMRTPTLVETLPSRLLARLTGASLRSAQRWRSGGTPRSASLARLRETDAVLALLGRGTSPTARRAWLETPNPALGGDRPVDRLARGDVAAARGAAQSHAAVDYV